MTKKIEYKFKKETDNFCSIKVNINHPKCFKKNKMEHRFPASARNMCKDIARDISLYYADQADLIMALRRDHGGTENASKLLCVVVVNGRDSSSSVATSIPEKYLNDTEKYLESPEFEQQCQNLVDAMISKLETHRI